MNTDSKNQPSMKWSMRLGSLAGIAVYVHATFLILLLWIALSYWRSEQNLQAVVQGVVFILALFGCVVLHELGHALTARHFGIQTRDIILLPIGGVASLEKMPDDPKEEILVALAGPAVNVVIAGLIWLFLSLQHPVPLDLSALLKGNMLQQLLVVNLFLAAFNLLPAFPMDGGRILRAVLALRMDHIAATRMAASVGQAFALWLGLVGLLYNPFLLFIALFVWIGAMAEAGTEEIRSLLHGTTTVPRPHHPFREPVTPGQPDPRHPAHPGRRAEGFPRDGRRQDRRRPDPGRSAAGPARTGSPGSGTRIHADEYRNCRYRRAP